MHIVAGGFDKVDFIPMSWSFDIDNDPSWQTNLSAKVQVGAAAMDAKSLQKMSFRIVKNEFGDLKFYIFGAVVVTSDFQEERRLELATANFRL